MNKNQIIENYGAKNITISDDLICWMRSNHAGETGAVWIYLGASCAFWSKKSEKWPPSIDKLSFIISKEERSFVERLRIDKAQGKSNGDLMSYRIQCELTSYLNSHFLSFLKNKITKLEIVKSRLRRILKP